MDKPEDHGGGKPDNLYCKYCTDPQGNLLPRETVRENMIKYHTQVLNKPQEEAESFVDEHMKTMPAWQEPTAGEVPVGGVSEPSAAAPSVQPGAAMPGEEPTQAPSSLGEQPTEPSVTEEPTETSPLQTPSESAGPTPGIAGEDKGEEPTV